MGKARFEKRKELLFGELVSAIDKRDVRRLRKIFPLEDYSSWIRIQAGKFPLKYDLREWRRVIFQDVVEPLFLKRGLRIGDEDNSRLHRRDNLVSCLEYHRSRLRGSRANEFSKAMKEFRADFRKAARGLGFPSWLIDGEVPPELRELERRRNAIEEEFQAFVKQNPVSSWNEEMEFKETAAADADRLINEAKKAVLPRRRYAIYFCNRLLWMLRLSRGKRGHPPEPFNVLIYHLIKLSTRLKWAAEQPPLSIFEPRYVPAKDGGLRMKTDWPLVFFLLIDLHFHVRRFPELKRFIVGHQRESVDMAFNKLRSWLSAIYKNFPKIRGGHFQAKNETGFRKVFVGSDRTLKFIRL
jgi:hypothetical protein